MKFFTFVSSMVLTLALTVSAQAATTTCYPEGQAGIKVAGVVSEVKSIHPNGSELTSYVMKLVGDQTYPSQFCYIESEDGANTSVDITPEIQINLMNVDAATQQAFTENLGKMMVVVGDFYLAHTAYHIRPVVFTPSELYIY